MINWEVCGIYLDRVVKFVRLDSIIKFNQSGSLSASVVLLCFENRITNKEDIQCLLERIVPLRPLAIVVAGRAVGEFFDELLVYLDRIDGANEHIMTSLCESLDIEEWLNTFLKSTWPAEERFDMWREYVILAIGKEAFQNEVYDHLGQAMGQVEPPPV